MWLKALVTALFGLLSAGVLYFVRRDGRNSERIRNLKTELERTAKEQENANQVHSSVDNMSDDDVRERLQNTRHN